MARLNSTGFETGSTSLSNIEFGNGMNTAIIISTTTVRSGTYSGQATTFTSTQGRGGLMKFATSAGAGPYYIRFYLNVATPPSADNTILYAGTGTAWDSGTTTIAIKMTSTNALKLFNGNVQVGSTSFGLNANQWYRVEMKYDATGGAAASTAELVINGSVVATSSSLTLSQTTVQHIGFGGNVRQEAQTAGSWFFDDIAINDSTTTNQNGYPGPGRIIHQLPAGAGDSTQWTIGGSGPVATNWQSVNEVPTDDAVTLVNESTANLSDLYRVGSTPLLSTDIVNVVCVGGRFANNVADATTAFQFQIEKTSGGTLSRSSSLTRNGTGWVTNSAALQPFPYPIVLYQDPDGIAWKKNTIESMQIGIFSGVVGVNKMQVSNIWALVDYTPNNEEIDSRRGIPTNMGHYIAVADGMSRSEVAN